jgi:hypothetical protein
VGIDYVHEHFDVEWSADEERDWMTVAIDFIAELLRGEVEIVTTYRGDSPALVKHRRVGGKERGASVLLAGLKVWRPKRTEVERVDFEARG